MKQFAKKKLTERRDFLMDMTTQPPLASIAHSYDKDFRAASHRVAEMELAVDQAKRKRRVSVARNNNPHYLRYLETAAYCIHDLAVARMEYLIAKHSMHAAHGILMIDHEIMGSSQPKVHRQSSYAAAKKSAATYNDNSSDELVSPKAVRAKKHHVDNHDPSEKTPLNSAKKPRKVPIESAPLSDDDDDASENGEPGFLEPPITPPISAKKKTPSRQEDADTPPAAKKSKPQARPAKAASPSMQ